MAPFLFFASSAAADDDNAAGAANAANAPAAEAALQYLQGSGILTRDFSTTDRCATNELHSTPFLYFCSRTKIVNAAKAQFHASCCKSTKQLRRHFLFPIDPVPATKLSK